MQRLNVNELKEGYITAKDIIDSNNNVIVSRNTALTQSVIQNLIKNWNDGVYVHGRPVKNDFGESYIQKDITNLEERFELVNDNELMRYLKNAIEDIIINYENS